MKQGQISQEQIIGILQQAERGEQTVAAICRAYGITETTFYRWRKKYGDLSVSDVLLSFVSYSWVAFFVWKSKAT